MNDPRTATPEEIAWLHAAISASSDHYATDDALDREVAVLIGRCFTQPRETLQQLGDRFGVRRERIRQIEARAQRRLRRNLSNPVVANAVIALVERNEAFAHDAFGLTNEQDRTAFVDWLRARHVEGE